jgi:Fe-Mn family superoxide dismutase
MPTRRDLLAGAPAFGIAVLGAAALSSSTSALAGDKSADKAADKSTDKAADKPAETKAAEKPAPTGPFTLAPLPYADTDLVPFISQHTFSYHYAKHHAGYVNKLNELYVGNESMGTTTEAVAKAAYGDKDRTPLYNNAAQSWNHAFLWNSMKKGGGGMPLNGKVADAMRAAFVDSEGFKKAFREAALGQFGSGWAWLVNNGGKLSCVKTANADSPLWTGAGTPILVLDVWEHAYYLDYQNKRVDYVNAFLDHLANWDFAEKNFV